ncbi:unnamed protein product [Arabidopsis thaliana]|uniref:(thale cress) hypothetical protein n=1 Tax=Arabidopsis thaliana TaxID=3702 RepID=A0A7G2EVS9_ARATH|nr:unnamed protein product [Arabidopsis thaliana]
MEKSQKQVTRPSNSRREYSKEIPIDLLIEIFSRLSTGDIARCRCVSKLWSSVPRLRDFTELFLKISSARPRILFTFLHNGKRMFYSISQHLHSDPSSSPLVPYYHMSFSKGMVPSYDNEIHAPVRGFLCSKASVYNPSTGECAYPYLELLVRGLREPILGTEEVCWRMIQCSLPHRPFRDEICIDGVLYYLANLISCKGKLGILWPVPSGDQSHEVTRSFVLRVLEDANKLIWSRTVYTLSFNWKKLVNKSLYIVGMTSGGEIVLSTRHLNYPFYIVYYNPVNNTAAKNEIQFGNIANKKAENSRIYTFIDHVEHMD